MRDECERHEATKEGSAAQRRNSDEQRSVAESAHRQQLRAAEAARSAAAEELRKEAGGLRRQLDELRAEHERSVTEAMETRERLQKEV